MYLLTNAKILYFVQKIAKIVNYQIQDCFTFSLSFSLSFSLCGVDGESSPLLSLLALALSSAAGEGCSSMQGSDPGYGGRHNSYFLAKSGGINLPITLSLQNTAIFSILHL